MPRPADSHLIAQRAALRDRARRIADATHIDDYLCWKILVCRELLEAGQLDNIHYLATFHTHVNDEVRESLDKIGRRMGITFDHQSLPPVETLPPLDRG